MVGQDIYAINEVVVFIKGNSAAAGGAIVVHQAGSALYILYLSPCRQSNAIVLIDAPFFAVDLKNFSVGVLSEVLICRLCVQQVDRSGFVHEMELGVRIKVEADDELALRIIHYLYREFSLFCNTEVTAYPIRWLKSSEIKS